jgi:hypothetical protein
MARIETRPTLVPDVPPELVVRRARRAHQCRTSGDRRHWDHGPLPPSHTPVIAPGEYHLEYLGESPAFQSGPRYCLACGVAAGLLRQRTESEE